MTKRENMRVKIARDVLTQLRLKRYEASQGSYINIRSETLSRALNDNDDDNATHYLDLLEQSFKTFFKKDKQVTCDVCALGAAFVSLVNIKNKCSVEGVMNEEGMWERLEGHFGSDNISLMESAFECSQMNNCGNGEISYEMLTMAAEWGQQYDDPNERLRAIMLNIIRNNGNFKLPKKWLVKAKAFEKENYC